MELKGRYGICRGEEERNEYSESQTINEAIWTTYFKELYKDNDFTGNDSTERQEHHAD